MTNYTCCDCGNPFTQSGRGRPRKRCETCSPRVAVSTGADKGWAYCEVCETKFPKRSSVSSVCSSRCTYLRKIARSGSKCYVCGDPIQVGSGSAKNGRSAHNDCRTANRLELHGEASTYDAGCRCDECRRAKTEQSRRWAESKTADLGLTPSGAYRRKRRGAPLESQTCAICGHPMKQSSFEKGRQPAHKRCKGFVYVPAKIRLAIYQRDDWTCHLCGEKTEPGAHHKSPWYPSLDHVVPKSMGGDEDPDNLRTCHLWCNVARGARPIEDFVASITA